MLSNGNSSHFLLLLLSSDYSYNKPSFRLQEAPSTSSPLPAPSALAVCASPQKLLRIHSCIYIAFKVECLSKDFEKKKCLQLARDFKHGTLSNFTAIVAN